jgi:sphingomyelin phosphodiesterase 2
MSVSPPSGLSAAAASSISPSVDRVTLLTFNVGLLQMNLFGFIPIFANPEYVSQRRPHIPQKIREINADIVSIQECYEDKHADFIMHSLADLYPYTARHRSPGFAPWKFQNGLLFLSKYPILESYIEKLHKAAPLEMWMANKSNLVMTVSIPSLGSVTLVNSHTTAGGATHPENPGVDSDREDELRQAVEACKVSPRLSVSHSQPRLFLSLLYLPLSLSRTLSLSLSGHSSSLSLPLR